MDSISIAWCHTDDLANHHIHMTWTYYFYLAWVTYSQPYNLATL